MSDEDKNIFEEFVNGAELTTFEYALAFNATPLLDEEHYGWLIEGRIRTNKPAPLPVYAGSTMPFGHDGELMPTSWTEHEGLAEFLPYPPKCRTSLFRRFCAWAAGFPVRRVVQAVRYVYKPVSVNLSGLYVGSDINEIVNEVISKDGWKEFEVRSVEVAYRMLEDGSPDAYSHLGLMHLRKVERELERMIERGENVNDISIGTVIKIQVSNRFKIGG